MHIARTTDVRPADRRPSPGHRLQPACRSTPRCARCRLVLDSRGVCWLERSSDTMLGPEERPRGRCFWIPEIVGSGAPRDHASPPPLTATPRRHGPAGAPRDHASPPARPWPGCPLTPRRARPWPGWPAGSIARIARTTDISPGCSHVQRCPPAPRATRGDPSVDAIPRGSGFLSSSVTPGGSRRGQRVWGRAQVSVVVDSCGRSEPRQSSLPAEPATRRCSRRRPGIARRERDLWSRPSRCGTAYRNHRRRPPRVRPVPPGSSRSARSPSP